MIVIEFWLHVSEAVNIIAMSPFDLSVQIYADCFEFSSGTKSGRITTWMIMQLSFITVNSISCSRRLGKTWKRQQTDFPRIVVWTKESERSIASEQLIIASLYSRQRSRFILTLPSRHWVCSEQNSSISMHCPLLHLTWPSAHVCLPGKRYVN